jgi:Sodium/hydrogen exchanger family
MTRRFSVYMLVIAAAVLAVAGLIHLGAARLSTQGVQAVAAPATPTGAFTPMLDNARLPLPRLILQVVVIVVVARAFGFLARRVGQSPVIGEIAAGMLLGPSVLGWMAPETSGFTLSECLDADPATAQSDWRAAVHVRCGSGTRAGLGPAGDRPDVAYP